MDFFVVDIIVSTFAVLNLFIAVIVNGMERGFADEMVVAEREHAAQQAASEQFVLDEVRALRTEIAQWRQQVPRAGA